MLEQISGDDSCAIYKICDAGKSKVNRLIVSTPDTHAICNDSLVMGVDYTEKLQTACSHTMKCLQADKIIHLEEKNTIVFNILRGGLNFGLREALARAFNWNLHGSSFVSAQRARNNDSSEEWHIIESDYKKVYMPEVTQIVIGDVVATGTSLEYGLNALIQQAKKNQIKLESILFFTFGGIRAEEILENIDAECRNIFPTYQSTTLCYFEGRFTVPSPSTPLSIKITGTDLVKYDALMAPGFIESQYLNPSFPLERCIIYDAGSRAFWLPEYLDDVIEYWGKVLDMVSQGITFKQLLNERAPFIDADVFGEISLANVAENQIRKLKLLQ